MIIPEQSFVAWKVIITILHLFAISTSVFRVWFRYRRGRMWMDDWTAVPPLVMDILNVVVIWLIYVDRGQKPVLNNMTALYWLISIPWFTIIWFTRISMILSITRIFPAWGTLRRFARAVAVSFATLYFGLMCWLFTTTCPKSDGNAPPTESTFQFCNYERFGLTVTGLTADLFACAFLVISPIVILWRTPANRGQNLLLYTYLGSNVIVTLFAIVACIFAYASTISGPGRLLVNGMLSQLEAIFSIIGANTLVFLTFLRQNDNGPDAINDEILWKKPPVKRPIRPSTATVSIVRSRVTDQIKRPQTAETQASTVSFPASEWYPQQTFAPKASESRTVTFVV